MPSRLIGVIPISMIACGYVVVGDTLCPMIKARLVVKQKFIHHYIPFKMCAITSTVQPLPSIL